jgi:hypothetical protein
MLLGQRTKDGYKEKMFSDDGIMYRVRNYDMRHKVNEVQKWKDNKTAHKDQPFRLKYHIPETLLIQIAEDLKKTYQGVRPSPYSREVVEIAKKKVMGDSDYKPFIVST